MVAVTDDMVEFRFYRPNARRVFIAGDFNKWQHGQIPMIRTQEGYWVARVRLQPGVFRFRYNADGEWFTDYAAFGVEQGPFGMDSVIRVGGEKSVA